MGTTSQLIGCLQRGGPASRTELSRQLRVSKPTLTVAIDGLLRRGMLEELGPGQASGGRPPTLLRLNDRYRLVLGAELDVGTFQLALGNLYGESLGHLEAAYLPHAPEAALRRAAGELLARCAPGAQVQGVVLGLPGVVGGGMLRYAPKLPALESPGALQRLRSAFDAPVQIHNDVNLAAVGEARGNELLVFLWIGSGLGVGVTQGQRVLSGHRGRAGEIGYLPLSTGPALEKVLSADGLARLLGLEAGGLDAALSSRAPDLLASPRAEPFFEALLLALQVLTLAFDPARIVLGGRIGIKLGGHLPQLRSRLLGCLPFAPELNLTGRPQQAVTGGALRLAAAAAFRDLLRELDGRRIRASPAP